MKTVTATDAQSHFGELLMQAQGEPVTITRNGKAAGVMLSAKDYRELKLQAPRQICSPRQVLADTHEF